MSYEVNKRVQVSRDLHKQLGSPVAHLPISKQKAFPLESQIKFAHHEPASRTSGWANGVLPRRSLGAMPTSPTYLITYRCYTIAAVSEQASTCMLETAVSMICTSIPRIMQAVCMQH